ncbi:hypothetical protein H7I00_11330, partial [Mycobacterium bohemicum]|nr:hypothetical protein [Mycobacterium bohemicum]
PRRDGGGQHTGAVALLEPGQLAAPIGLGAGLDGWSCSTDTDRRRRRAVLREHGDEFADMNVDVDPDWGTSELASVASDNGAGALGFTGTAPRAAAAAASGLTKLAGDEFGGGARRPMVPSTWECDGPEEGGDDG